MKLTIFQERLPLPVEGYGGTERVSQAHFIGQCELNIHEVTLVCRSESTISHPNGNVIKLDEEILQDLRKGKRKVKDYIPDGDIILVQFPESTDPMDLTDTNYTRVSVCNGDVGEASGSKYQVFVSQGQKAAHEMMRSDYSENKFVVHNGILPNDFELVKKRKEIVWFSSLDGRKGHHLIPYISETVGDIKVAGSHGQFHHPNVYWYGELKTEKEKSEFLSDAEVYIHTAQTPHFNEPFGLTLVEAQFCGVPVVCLNSGGVSEVVFDTDYVFTNVNDLIKCLQDKPYLKHEPQAIRRWSISKFNHTALAERYNKIFYEVLMNENKHNI